jgi:homoserine dehydrogenase
MFEASVGGGIPIIRPLMQCLAANDITAVRGVLNGTTNYILTQMKRNGKDFRQALAEAQSLGYAEANPDNDIEGHDACRKIAILSGIAFEEFIDYREIPTEGISRITGRDFRYASAVGHTIKLVAASSRTNGCVEAIVAPMLIPADHPRYGGEDVFNAIVVTGSAVGDAMFYGRGAGKLPTASAIVADMIDIIRNPQVMAPLWGSARKGCLADPGQSLYRYLIRMSGLSREQERILPGLFPEAVPVTLPQCGVESEVAFTTGNMTEFACREALDSLGPVDPKPEDDRDAQTDGLRINRIRFIQRTTDRTVSV